MVVLNIVTCMECDYTRVLDWWPDLLHTLIQRVTTLYTHTHTHTSVYSHFFTCRYSIAASNGGRSTSSGFPKCRRPPLPVSNSNSSHRLNLSSPLTHSPTSCSSLHLTDFTPLTVLRVTPRNGQHRKHHYSVEVCGQLPSSGRFLVVCFAVVA
jgi:hypothetical protein